MKKYLAIMTAFFITISSTVFSFAEDTGFENLTKEQKAQYLIELMEFIKNNHVEKPTEEELIEGAIKGMFGKLDVHSNFFNKTEYKEVQESISGSFSGIGIRIKQANGYITVVEPIEGTPGERAGIVPEDKIATVDGKDIKGITTEEAVKIMRGKEGTKVRIGILRGKNEELIHFDIIRAEITVNPIEYKLLENTKDKIGYIDIDTFNANTLSSMQEAMIYMKSEEVEKIVIDLRNNPGGYLDQVVQVLGYFIPEGPIVHVKNSDGSKDTYLSKTKNPNYKLVVLVNELSASASEIFAGAVQDTEVGVIVGKKTYGKGSVQNVLESVNQTGFKLTVAEYFTPNENKVNGEGITPDVEVENEFGTNGIDINRIPEFSENPQLKIGDVSLDTLAAEQILSILGYKLENVDGVYDYETKEAVYAYQKALEIVQTGEVNKQVADKLKKSLDEKLPDLYQDKQLQKAIEIIEER